MSVIVTARCEAPPRLVAAVRADARQLLTALGENGADLSVVLLNDAEIHVLNRTYRGKNRSTDVLAFAMREGARTRGDEALLGDVIISLETAARQAQRRRVSLADEVRTLLVHGALHLLGYDHERSRAEARRMKLMERRLAAILRTGAGGAQVADSRSRCDSSRTSVPGGTVHKRAADRLERPRRRRYK